jgi:hypothetical protein
MLLQGMSAKVFTQKNVPIFEKNFVNKYRNIFSIISSFAYLDLK